MTTLLFGAPHGDIFEGYEDQSIYMEDGKCWPPKDTLIFEGQWIRKMLFRLEEELSEEFPEHRDHFLFMGCFEVTPNQRKKAVNRIVDAYDDDCLYIEPHVNAESTLKLKLTKSVWGKAEGHRVFYNKKAGVELARNVSSIIQEGKPMPTDERSPLPAPWGYIRGIKCKALLVENYFMTNESESRIAAQDSSIWAFMDCYKQIARMIWGPGIG